MILISEIKQIILILRNLYLQQVFDMRDLLLEIYITYHYVFNPKLY